MTSDFAPKMQMAIALALAEAQHQRFPHPSAGSGQALGTPHLFTRWLDRIPHLGYNETYPTSKEGRER